MIPRAGTTGRGLIRLASERFAESAWSSTCSLKYQPASPPSASTTITKPSSARARNCAVSRAWFFSRRRIWRMQAGPGLGLAPAEAQRLEQHQQRHPPHSPQEHTSALQSLTPPSYAALRLTTQPPPTPHPPTPPPP